VLRQFTDARIALGRAGVSLPTEEWLRFSLAHAQARDAVHRPLELAPLTERLNALGIQYDTVHSAAPNRDAYLRRPDLGRRLDETSKAHLAAYASAPVDLVLVVADGLSSMAITQNALPLIERLWPTFIARGWSLAPVTLALQARVALGDEVGELRRARCVVVLIGERPGLSSPDSLGIYITWAPRVGRVDAERNCISNVRPAGLHYDAACHKLCWLLDEAFTRRLSGVALKDESDQRQIADTAGLTQIGM
jgi:ethanolamine ammonia-lyase small subunit